MDEKSKTFVVHMASLNLIPGIHPNKAAQIASLLTKEINIPDEYSNFVNVFLKEKALVLSEQIEFNQYIVELEEDK